MSAAFKEQGVMKIQVTTGNLDIQVVNRKEYALTGWSGFGEWAGGGWGRKECVNQGIGQGEIEKEERGVCQEKQGHLCQLAWDILWIVSGCVWMHVCVCYTHTSPVHIPSFTKSLPSSPRTYQNTHISTCHAEVGNARSATLMYIRPRTGHR